MVNAFGRHRRSPNPFHLFKINKAAESDWRAGAWILERRHPEDFGKQEKIEHLTPALLDAYLPVEVEPEVPQRIRKQNAMVEFAGQFGAILLKNRKTKIEAE